MIDIHSHIVNGVDDGSKGIEMSLKMAEEASKVGITDIICTPHYILGQYESERKKMKEYIRLLQKEIEKKAIPIQLHHGSEIYVEEGIEDALEKEEISTMAESNYILIEFSMNYLSYGIGDFLFNVSSLGYFPIIAHPERYSYVQKDPNIVYDWIEKGAYIQSNYGSLLGNYGTKAEKTVKKLLKNHMVHFLASDAHRDHSVYLKLPEAKAKLEKILLKEETDLLTFQNPMAILKKKEIEKIEPKMYKKRWL